MVTTEAAVLYRPETDEIRFLPEGPYQLPDETVSFVAIQHGTDSVKGSINVLNPQDGTCRRFDLPGRPGFAFPTDRPGVFVAGVEREIGFFDTAAGTWTPAVNGVDASVRNTIINDAVVFDDNLIFGCKELTFSKKIAGLYLWRRRDRRLVRLRNDQICSNGKAVIRGDNGGPILYDIDSPSKQITKSELDIERGLIGQPEIVVDLSAEPVFPDGMILTPDHRSLIVALYDPGDPEAGAARQYCLQSGELQRIWICPGSPRVTCPQLIRLQGGICLLLTTAVEHMPSEQQARHPNAGCLFVGETEFSAIGDQPVFSVFW